MTYVQYRPYRPIHVMVSDGDGNSIAYFVPFVFVCFVCFVLFITLSVSGGPGEGKPI